jgi:hypothetical protein
LSSILLKIFYDWDEYMKLVDVKDCGEGQKMPGHLRVVKAGKKGRWGKGEK